ncbi:phosphohistidine phosphatase SixA [Thalassotalea profundi]|uniref:Phosphohistidine phosphatase n=1 Tax=Thalassotalea profundi TaxID=2036687 RepID=A0ABQ3IGH2_9GAMM|nr:phosphohistidine phosphatase SixA [Thalassotalea profundi]GHE80289.1 phosphohistidine phosphatase [Thalassotalea profundi]
MQLFVMRHGQANPFGKADAERALTKCGFDEVDKIGQWLAIANHKIDKVLVSPYMRAQQTAKQLIKSSGIKVPLNTIDFITPEGNAAQVHDYIDGVFASEEVERVLIVSHMPLVSYLVAELIKEQNAPIFQTAAIAHIEYDPSTMKGRLIQIMSPNEL